MQLRLCYFDQQAPIDTCLWEQYQLYLPPTWTQEKADAWYTCFAQNVGAPGVWGMQAWREADGVGLTGSQQTYVWGASDQLLPSGEIVYLVEMLPAVAPFDLSGVALSELKVFALIGGLWADRGTFPVAGRPQLRSVPAAGPRGVGSYTSYAELTLADVDGDGNADVEIEAAQWVGYDEATESFVAKPTP